MCQSVVVINYGEMRQPRNVIIGLVGRTNVRLWLRLLKNSAEAVEKL
jgi:hypothetical protein